jgi:hypothetical protein
MNRQRQNRLLFIWIGVQMKALFSLLVTILVAPGYSFASPSAPTCQGLFAEFLTEASSTKVDFRSPHKIPETFDIQGAIQTPAGEFVAKSFGQALKREDVQSKLKAANPNSVIYEALLAESNGGGKLRLTRLDTSFESGAFNHIELLALLQVNPQLANALGFYRVEGFPELVWLPNAKQLNYRLGQLAQARGFGNPVFDFQEVASVVGSKAYLQLVANGKLPFSKNDINYEVHDGMHAVALAALNGTPATRKILKAASSRKTAILHIGKRLTEQFGEQGKELEKWLIHQETSLESSDSIEYTMLLSILMTGNYDYGSAMMAQLKHQLSSKQNLELTVNRVSKLLGIYSHGLKPLEKIRNEMLQGKDPEAAQSIMKIFNEEIKKIEHISEQDIAQGSSDLMDFFAHDIFSPEVSADGKSRPSRFIINE